MIFITRNFSLVSPAVAVDRNNPLIGYDSVVTTSSISATQSDSDYPVTNVVNSSLSSLWRADEAGENAITFTQPDDIFETNTIDYIGIARHNFGSARIAVKPQGRDTSDGDWYDLAPETMPKDDSPLMFWFDESSCQAVQLVLSEGVAAPQIAVLRIGKSLQLQHSLIVPGDHVRLIDAKQSNIVNGISDAGKLFLGRIANGESYSTSINTIMTKSFFDLNLRDFLSTAVTDAFFLSVFPETEPNDVGYCWLLNDPQPAVQLEIDLVRLRLDYAGVV